MNDETMSEDIRLLIAALKNSAPANPIVQPPMSPQQAGGMMILKWVGGVFGTLIGAGLTAGMFWLINSVNIQGDKVDALVQTQASDKLLMAEKEKTTNGKLEFITTELKDVKANTKDRFTRDDFLREIKPVVDQSNRAIDMLESRSVFMDATNKRLTLLESKLE